MKRKIFTSMLLLALVTALLSVTLLAMAVHQQRSEDMHREMNNQTAYIAAGIAAGGTGYLSEIQGADKDSRITLIAPDGTVTFDNRVPLAQLDNHGDRPEVIDALQNGVGETVRMSNTLGSQTYYHAIRLSDGIILRISSKTDSMLTTIADSYPILLLNILLVLGLAFFIAGGQTKRIVQPINSLDLEHPIENEIYDELSPLLIRIHRQNAYIEDQMKELQKEQEHFLKITENMEEGLVITDERGYLISVNQSALRFLDAGQEVVGRHFSSLNRSQPLERAVNSALNGSFAEEGFLLNGRHYQFRATPVSEEEKVSGAIILILDVTEKQKAENIRREFTANVSHELKTPLTAISGFAELIKDNMVRQEDIPSFAAKIHDEATRMVALVEDIIRLSQLDEKEVSFATGAIDLLETSKKVAARLSSMAENQGVALAVSGQNASIQGVPQLIEELVANLVENAIKYNKEAGEVSVQVTDAGSSVTLSVADTGIGISPEHQARIFERFYRVDKSHSKETGGTGLGLAIVKHIANYHNAEIKLESCVNQGTKVVVIFPKQQLQKET
jgi:two-component system phosphate regulon sensor histidine kinase PhoR